MKEKNIQTEFANAAGMLASRLSLSPIAGQIYGLLYMSPEPVSLNEMVKKLNISKGSASINVRTLESWGAVKKVWVDNSRKDYYEANTDTLDIVFRKLRDGLDRRLKDLGNELSGIQQSVREKTNSSEEKNFYAERLKNAKDMYNKAMQLLDLLSGSAEAD